MRLDFMLNSTNANLFQAMLIVLLLLACFSCEASIDVVKNHEAAAQIIIPEHSLPVVTYAAQELQYHIEQATGVKVPVISENESISTDKARIYLGECKDTIQAGINPLSLSPNAFRIQLEGQNLYIAGRDSDGSPLRDDVFAGTLFAVYEFLDKQMGVRWVWPGKLGEVIPKTKSIAIKKWDQTHTPKLVHTRLRFGGTYMGTYEGWASKETRDNFVTDTIKWMRRHRFARAVSLEYGHGFENYWDRFSKDHLEYFNLLPNGKREPDKLYFGGQAALVSMCLSEPGLWTQRVEEWKTQRTATKPWINCAENDTQNRCVCPNCLAWDASAPGDERSVEKAKSKFAENDPNWWIYLGSLSDRYSKWLLAVQNEARKTDADATVLGYAYTNYSGQPIKTKLNDKVVIAIVPNSFYPFNDAKSDIFRKQWGGWASAGASLYLRPNDYLECHPFPVYYADRYGEDFKFAYKQGMIATDFDSLTGMFGTQGLNLYVLARIHTHPDWPVSKIINEYYSAFGPAAKEVKKYFNNWKAVSDAATDNQINEAVKRKDVQGYMHWIFFTRVADAVFTPDVMSKSRSLLKSAEMATKNDKTAEERVAFLEKGFTNVELTLAAQSAYEKYKSNGNLDDFRAALLKLDSYRASVESDYICNMGNLAWSENLTWDRTKLKILEAPGEELNAGWKFMWDQNDIGVKDAWFAEDKKDSDWYDIQVDKFYGDQEVGKKWKEEYGADYLGISWYRLRFSTKSDKSYKQVKLFFGSLDEAGKVWVNGKLVLDRSYPFEGDMDSWKKPFEVDVTEHVYPDRPNTLAVRVENKTGAGGIWQQVKLICD